MTETLISALVLVALLVGMAALALLVRHDSFAGPGVACQPRDELGPFGFSRRQP
jgi:hypothetical protein